MVREALFLNSRVRRSLAAATSILSLAIAGCGGSDDPPAGPAEPAAMVSSASGAFTLTTFAGDAQAGLRFAGFVTEGTVVIENKGKRAGPFALRQEIGYEDPGAGAGRASTEVGLRIVDTTGEGAARELYRGPVAGLRSVPVGEIPAGASREYAFKLTPRTPLRPSRLDLRYRWVPGGASAPPADRPQPGERPGPRLGVRLRIPPEQSVLATRKILIFARCPRRCRLEAQATLRARSRMPIDLTVNVGRPSTSRRPALLELRASREAFSVIRAALTRGPPVTVTLRVRASDATGGTGIATERIRLKPVPDARPGG